MSPIAGVRWTPSESVDRTPSPLSFGIQVGGEDTAATERSNCTTIKISSSSKPGFAVRGPASHRQYIVQPPGAHAGREITGEARPLDGNPTPLAFPLRERNFTNRPRVVHVEARLAAAPKLFDGYFRSDFFQPQS